MSWKNFFRSAFTSSNRKRSSKRPSFKPRVVQLEDRNLPGTTLTGALAMSLADSAALLSEQAHVAQMDPGSQGWQSDAGGKADADDAAEKAEAVRKAAADATRDALFALFTQKNELHNAASPPNESQAPPSVSQANEPLQLPEGFVESQAVKLKAGQESPHGGSVPLGGGEPGASAASRVASAPGDTTTPIVNPAGHDMPEEANAKGLNRAASTIADPATTTTLTSSASGPILPLSAPLPARSSS